MRPFRLLIACDKFKGSFDAQQACAAIAHGWRQGWPNHAAGGLEMDLCPIADGGEGFSAAMVAALEGTWHQAPCHDALGRAITAEYGTVRRSDGLHAVIEMAQAAGLWRIAADERDIRHAHTFGVGELLRHASQQHQLASIFLGIGGSATNDGGLGMAAALGWCFYDETGEKLAPHPANISRIVRIDDSQRVNLPPIIAACDVNHPLCGEMGAAAVFSPQKGASPDDVVFLDTAMRQLVKLCGAEQGALEPGAGAAGGLGFGLLQWTNSARLQSGFDLIAHALELRRRIERADLVITGEGSLDEQSLGGKGPIGVAEMAAELGRPCLAMAGRISEELRQHPLFAATHALLDAGLSLEETIQQGSALLEQRAAIAAAAWSLLALPLRPDPA